ncbi:YbaL family putative K(+) efflux transporter [Thermomonas sp.]|uniref:YbaL family putative K(+) efflux transporter n=1 Tax=Thermomonas sp. TaxID=1971895 RepID=UPI0024891D99|nr:YbaL family putative K(+) efflux transporter [Thermomonas sp.]MDI1254323.1 YbaL family putative K(+) efflux transporter [Thermomonas sp.]
MPHHTSLITLLCLGFVLAFLFGMLAQRLRLSPLAGYLLAGVVAGPFTPGFVGDQTLAPQLAEIGVILLMFGVGLHFSLKDLMQVRRVVVPGALARIVLMTALGFGVGRFFGWDDGTGIVFGLSLSVASTVVLLRTLEDHQLLDSRLGQVTIGWVVVEDLAMVLALVLLPPLADSLHGEQATPLLPVILKTVLKIGLFIAFMLVVGRRVIPWILERVAGTGSRELFTLCVLAVAMGVAFGAAAMFGVSFALGAFFAGMLLNESEFSHKAANDSLPLRDAFAVLFFVSVGMLFDPMILVQHPIQVLLTFGLIVAVKWLVTWASLRLLGERPGDATLAASALAQIGEFSFIVIGLAVSLKMMQPEVRDLVLAGALLSIIANPFLVTPLVGRVKRRRQLAGANTPGPMSELVNHTIVIGYGRVGRDLLRLLRDRGVPVALIEEDMDRVIQARGEGIPAVRGNAVLPQVLAGARPEAARLAILAIPRALEGGEVIAQLRKLNPEITVLARAHSEAEVKHLLAHGADAAVLAERELAHSLTDMVMSTPPYRPARTT